MLLLYWWWRSDASAVRIGPTEIAFEAKNELVVLPIVAGERAADHAIGRDTILGYNSVFFDMGATPQITDMSADVKAGPIYTGGGAATGRGALTGISAADATCAHTTVNAAAIIAIDKRRMAAPKPSSDAK